MKISFRFKFLSAVGDWPNLAVMLFFNSFFFLGSRNALVSDVENQRQQKLEIDLMVSLMMYQKSFLFVRGFKYFRFFGIAICS